MKNEQINAIFQIIHSSGIMKYTLKSRSKKEKEKTPPSNFQRHSIVDPNFILYFNDLYNKHITKF